MRLLVSTLFTLTVVSIAQVSFAAGERISALHCQNDPKNEGNNAVYPTQNAQWYSNGIGGGYLLCPIPNTSEYPATTITEIWADTYNGTANSSEIWACEAYFNAEGGTCISAASGTDATGAQTITVYNPGYNGVGYEYDYPYLEVYIGAAGYFLGYGTVTNP
jgi:hypothetical protein